jgi:RNA-directed DNA polymerase
LARAVRKCYYWNEGYWEHPGVPFCRYVDHVVVHAVTLRQAERLRSAIEARMVEVGLMLDPVKTKIVYSKDNGRRDSYEHESFTFLGFTFPAPGARDKYGVIFASFLPAVSREALKALGQRARRWRIRLQISSDLADLARWMNPIVGGWMQ